MKKSRETGKDAQVEDITLTKHGNNGDYLSWTYKGVEYWAQGEFYVENNNMLHHTFITHDGEEIEITYQYS